MPQIRIATFNLENFDETAPTAHPSLAERIRLMKPQINRLRADIACFQEVHGQERPGQPRALLALAASRLPPASSGPRTSPDWKAPRRSCGLAFVLPAP
ncbi:hypothetical protein ABZ478_38460 [Streptomyces sp. NPDC005706]|uniref:hypothetical protein n=1 Tax=Streptomyces sp. NPDC005706 TaxID=3157169 RepID=UPI0033D13677